jgi:hypothetical protein
MSLRRQASPKEKRSPRGKAAELAAWLARAGRARPPEEARGSEGVAAPGSVAPANSIEEREGPARIGDREWEQLRAWLAPISENYLRRLLRESGAPLAPLIEGVRQESLDALEASLLKLLEEYEAGGRERRARARRVVITAKDHARWALRRGEENRTEKQEMILWMTTWLENPPLFREWVRLRRAAMS